MNCHSRRVLPFPARRLVNRQRGFTLIEFIVASAILAVMGGAAYAGWFNITKIGQRTEETTQRYEQLQRTFQHFGADFEQIVKRDSIDELGGRRKSLELSEAGEYVIQVTRGGWTNPALLQLPPRSDLQRVAYRIDNDSRLLRRYWYHVDKFDSASFRDRVLLKDVQALTFRFMDFSGAWHNNWPPEDNVEEGFNELPVGLEATLEIENFGTVKRLFVLPN